MSIPSSWIRLSGIAIENRKLIGDWLRLNSTKAFLDELEAKYGKPQIVVVKGGDRRRQGVWGTTEVAVRVRQWAFGQKVKSFRFESHHRNKVKNFFPDSKTEVKTPAGVCDVVTSKYAIEVKESRGWKSAIGQAQVYAYYLNLKPAIYLIGEVPKECYEVCKKLGVKVFDWKQFV